MTFKPSSYIKLTGYYPKDYVAYVLASSITVVSENATNPNSRGSIVCTGGKELMVIESPEQVLKLIANSQPL